MATHNIWKVKVKDIVASSLESLNIHAGNCQQNKTTLARDLDQAIRVRFLFDCFLFIFGEELFDVKIARDCRKPEISSFFKVPHGLLELILQIFMVFSCLGLSGGWFVKIVIIAYIKLVVAARASVIFRILGFVAVSTSYLWSHCWLWNKV